MPFPIIPIPQKT